MRHHKFLILGVIVFFAGCAKAAHLQPLLTIKAYSDSKDQQHAYVESQDIKFKKLLDAVEKGELKKNLSEHYIRKRFGDPIFARPAQRNGKNYQQWLFRYAVRYFDSPKVYMFFDERERLKDWEFVPAPQPASRDAQ